MSSRTLPHSWPSGRTSQRTSVKTGEYQTSGPQHCCITGTPQWSARPREGGTSKNLLHCHSSCPVPTLTPCSALCRLLIAGTESSDLQHILSLLEFTKDLLLTSSYLSSSHVSRQHVKFLVTHYLNVTDSRWCSWSVSTTVVGGGQEVFWRKRVLGHG